MATVPEANRILWEVLDAIYAAQLDAAQRTQDAIDEIAAKHPEIVHDPLARDALRAAVGRQGGVKRYAESQVALAETMKAYWDQRSNAPDGGSEPMPLVRRSGPHPLMSAISQRQKTTATVVE